MNYEFQKTENEFLTALLLGCMVDDISLMGENMIGWKFVSGQSPNLAHLMNKLMNATYPNGLPLTDKWLSFNGIAHVDYQSDIWDKF